MAYQIQYLLAVDRATVSEWLCRLNGAIEENDRPKEPTHGEFEFWDGLWLNVQIAETASVLSFPQLIYSHFLFAGPMISSWVGQIEERLCCELNGVPIIRVDELLFGEWEHSSAQDWWQMPRPLDSLKQWLTETQDDVRYYRFFGAVEECS